MIQNPFRSTATVLCATLATATLSVATAGSAHAGETQLIAISGEPAPDGNGSFSSFRIGVLNDAGQVAFKGFLENTSGVTTDTTGVFRGDGSPGGLVQIARDGQAAPDGNGVFAGVSDPLINELGQVAFSAGFTGTSGGTTDNGGINRGDGVPANLLQIARKGATAPGGNGTLSSILIYSLNDAGQMAVGAGFLGTSGGTTDDTGVFRADGPGTLVEIAREGQTAPDGDGTYSILSSAGINASGQVSFAGRLIGTTNTEGLFRGDGTAGPVQIARDGETVPGGNGEYSTFGTAVINDSGQVAYTTILSGTAGGTTDNSGVYRADGSNPTIELVRRGDLVPDGNGNHRNFGGVTINASGASAYTGFSLSNTSGGSEDERGIFLSGPSPAIQLQLIREGDTVPGGNGVFSAFSTAALNDAGQIALLANLRDTVGGATDNEGIFFYDTSLGLMTVAQKGDSLFGDTITALFFSGYGGEAGDEASGFNELGQVAFNFTLADGRSGIAVWSVPEPGTFALFSVGALALLRRRSGRRGRI